MKITKKQEEIFYLFSSLFMQSGSLMLFFYMGIIIGLYNMKIENNYLLFLIFLILFLGVIFNTVYWYCSTNEYLLRNNKKIVDIK